jgi:hypothetical protein
MKVRYIALLLNLLAAAMLTAQTRRVSTGAVYNSSAYSESAMPEKRVETFVSLGSNLNPGCVEQPTGFIGIVSSSTDIYPGGTMTFYCNGKELATVDLVGGVDGFFTTTFSKPRTYRIRASYSGDDTHKPSSAKMLQSITVFAQSK